MNPHDLLSGSRPSLDRKPHKSGAIAFFVVLAAGLSYAAFSIVHDVHGVGETNIATGAIIMLGLALLIALGFEFVNGFHDTANAVASVIYTHSLDPHGRRPAGPACSTSSGVLASSSGAVAFTVVNAAAGRADPAGSAAAPAMP